MQDGVLINTITWTMKMYGHFKSIDEGIGYIHFKPARCGMYNVHDVLVHDKVLMVNF